MRAVNPLKIERARLRSGEILPLLVHRATGLPIEAPAYWITSSERPLNKAAATLEKRLRNLMFLYLWAETLRTSPEELVCAPTFLTLEQLNDLQRFCQYPLEMAIFRALEHRDVKPKIVSIKSRKGHRKRNQASPAEVANRLSTIHAFIEHLSLAHAYGLARDSAVRTQYDASRREILELLKSRSAAIQPQRFSSSPREGLSPKMRLRLLEVIQVGHPENPWRPRVQRRNCLIVHLFYDFGIRGGELLGLKTTDVRIGPDGGLLSIVRRPQDPKDKRSAKPNVKTLGRELHMANYIGLQISEYMRERSKLPLAKQHPYLFVSSQNGAPLSIWSITKVFLSLRTRVKDLPDNLTAHVLRHNWNDIFSEMSDKAAPNRSQADASKEENARAYAQGWSSIYTARHYTKRWTREAANERIIKMQNRRVVVLPPEDLDDEILF